MGKDDESKKNIEMKKIQKFGSYHNFEFVGDNAIKVRKVFAVGDVKSVKESSVLINE